MLDFMPPYLFLTYLIALATGMLSLAWVARRSHHHYSPVTESLIPPLLFYNLWMLTWLIRQFVQTTLLEKLDPGQGRVLTLALTWTSMVVAILWGHAYLAFTLLSTQSDQAERRVRFAQRAAFLLVGGTAILSVVLLLLHQEPLFRIFSRGLSSLIFLVVAIFSLRLFYRAHRGGDEASWRRLRILGAAYSVFFVLLTTLVLWNRFSQQIPKFTFTAIHVGLVILYNLLTVIWIQLFDRTLPKPVAVSPDPLPLRAKGPTFQGGFGISKREGEVIQLICQGLTNQEIADTLFISVKTVKDHNYRIFQKTGVRNRVELVQLAQEPGLPEQAV